MKNTQEKANEFYDYWLSVHGFLPQRDEPEINDKFLDIIFTDIDKETGRLNNQASEVYFHGTIQRWRDNIKKVGLRANEGAACFTRKFAHALENFAIMGNYTMIGNKSVDEEIHILAEEGIIDKNSPKKEKAKQAFDYWCKDEVQEKEGLLTVWQPPKDAVALDCQVKKIHKRHFAIYDTSKGENAVERRRALSDQKRGERIHLDNKYLIAEIKPTKKLRDEVSRLDKKFRKRKDIEENNLNKVLDGAILFLKEGYFKKQIIDEILISIKEGIVLSLVWKMINDMIKKQDYQSNLTGLKGLDLTSDYLDNYRNKVLKKLREELRNK